MSDDDLKAYDLSAWDAPPAPATLADGVIARMTSTDAAIAAAMHRRGTRRWWIAGGVAAGAVAASLGLWLALRTPSAGSSTGALVAQKPQHVELGATSANVDTGADLTWWRTGTTLHVEQHRGASTWIVGGDDHLVIDTGAHTGSGAMNATVDATGASLRVEVSMNMTDVRVIGASAATAAAVAMVTVVVYEGHVKATSGGQTMVVMPGSTVEAKAGQPPREAQNVGATLPLPTIAGADLALPVGESATIHDPRGTTAIQFLSRCKDHTDVELAPQNVKVSNPDTKGSTGAITLSPGAYRYALRCDGESTPSTTGTVTIVQDAGTSALGPDGDAENPTHAASIDLPIDGAAWPDPIHIVGDTLSNATVSVGGRAIIVDSNAHFAGDLMRPPGTTVIAIRVTDDAGGIHYYIRRSGTGKDVTVATHTDPLPKSDCDEVSCVLNNYSGPCCFNFRTNDTPDKAAVDKAIAAARAELDKCGDNSTGGVVKLKVTIKPDGHVKNVGVTSAPDPELGVCVADTLLRLKLEGSKHGGTLPISIVIPASKTQNAQTCDPEPLVAAGTNSEALGAHQQALKQFEDALRCKVDARTIQLGFMAACNATNAVKAREFWAKMSRDMQERNLQMCVRSHITRDMLNAGLADTTGSLTVVAKQPARLFIDGRDTGLTTPVADLTVDPGRHKIMLIAKGKSSTYSVTVETGKTTKFSADNE